MVQKKIYKRKNLAVKFIGCLTKNGKRNLFYKIFGSALKLTCKVLNIKSAIVLRTIVKRLGTVVELRKIKIRKNMHLVPIPVNAGRRNYLIVKQILTAIRNDSQKFSLLYKLKRELTNIVIAQNSASLKQRSAFFVEVRNNRANTHYRW